MAREIDPTNLDEQDKSYLRERPWMIDTYRRRGFAAEMDAVENSKDTPDDPTRLATTDDLRVGTQTPQRDVAPPNGVVAGEEVDDDYESWSKADLEAEIDARNSEEDRAEDSKISKTGTKAELADRLHEDDAAA
jgi:hypothetical protein